MATSRSIPTAPLRRLPRASAKFAPALAAALAALLLHALPLRAQHPDFYLQPDTLVFGYSAGLVESVYVTCDIDLRWYVSNPQAGGDLFAIDVYEGVSSDFIQVRTLQSNRTGSDRRCTFYFRDDNWHSANLVIIQKPYVEPPPPPPEPDPDWDLDVPGNWILSRSYSDPADSSVFHDDITFYDGLGYPVQTVLVGASPAPARRPGEPVFQTERNIVRPVVYDSMRRPDAVSYLPYPSSTSGRVRENDPLAAQAAWYESKHPGEGDFAFSSTSYEPSPLSRVTATRRPGADYAETSPSGDRPVTTSYSANRPGEVRLLSLLPDGSLSVDGFRPPGSLHRTETANEDGLVSVSFSDAFGRTVLLRSIAPDRSDSLDTHVVHGPDGRPAVTLLPSGSRLLADGTFPLPDSSDVNSSLLARHATLFSFDGRGRLLRRKLPGSAWEEFSYSPAGRPVSWQDGRLRGLGLRLTFHYDDLGRPAETRLERVMHRLPLIPADSVLVADPALPWLSDPFAGLPRPDTISFTPGAVLRREFRGSYDGMPPQLAFLPEDGVPPADTLRLAGLLTRERVAVFSPGSSAVAGHVERAFFYDAAGSLIQTAELSPDGHVSRSSAARDLAGNVLVSVERHGSDVLRSSFSYDARGRLLSETHSLVSPRDSAATVITHSYDRLGRRVSSSFSDRVARRRPGFPLGVSGGLISPDLSSALPAPAGLGAVSVRDAFDIRGDLVSRAAVSEYAAGVQLPVARTLFVSGLRRQRPELQGSEPRFGGKISEWTYSGANKATARTWSLAYDPFGRLASAVLLRDDGSPAGASETLAFGPDANLLSATRSTDGDGADSLALSYDGVLLSSAGGRPAEHDASGALSLHPLSGARVIRNPLGGLAALERDGSARILASCDADGRLISLSDSARTTGLVRRGSFSYAITDGREALAGVPFPGGRFVRDERGSTGVIHFVTDHIGTPRALVSGGDVVARLDLLPSGAVLSASGFDGLPGDADRLRFAGKEDLSGPSLGLLPLLDFGARLYDPLTLAWDSPDPLADKYPSLSPYAYCAGDPVNFRDPDGKVFETAWDVTSLVLGVGSFSRNVREGNVWDAVLDAAGVLADAVSVALPFVPGGASAAIAGFRSADALLDAARSADGLSDAATDAVRAAESISAPTVSYRSFTRANFRENLYRRTGEAKAGMDAHHTLPVKFENKFNEIGININDPKYGEWVEQSIHRRNAYRYNQDWKKFFDKYESKNLTPTQDDVMNYLHELKMRDNDIQKTK